MIDFLLALTSDYTFRVVTLGSAILGCTSGVLGTFAVLRKQSLLGDAISHSALPGIAIAFLLTSSKSPAVLLTGALLAGWISALCMMAIVKVTHIKYDGALAIILSVFFGFGLMLLSVVQKMPTARQAGLNKFLFGQAATLLKEDVITMALLGGLAILLTIVFWKEFKLLSFNPDFGTSLGFSMRTIDILLTSLLVIAIVVGLQTVGVVLMSVMIIAPAAAARQWTDKLGVMAIIAAFIGALSGVIGATISSQANKIPTGPVIVLVGFSIVIISLLFAPKRGILYRVLRQYENQNRLGMTMILEDIYLFGLKDINGVSPFKLLEKRSITRPRKLLKYLKKLESHRFIERAKDTDHEEWIITTKGINELRKVNKKTGGDFYE